MPEPEAPEPGSITLTFQFYKKAGSGCCQAVFSFLPNTLCPTALPPAFTGSSTTLDF